LSNAWPNACVCHKKKVFHSKAKEYSTERSMSVTSPCPCYMPVLHLLHSPTLRNACLYISSCIWHSINYHQHSLAHAPLHSSCIINGHFIALSLIQILWQWDYMCSNITIPVLWRNPSLSWEYFNLKSAEHKHYRNTKQTKSNNKYSAWFVGIFLSHWASCTIVHTENYVSVSIILTFDR